MLFIDDFLKKIEGAKPENLLLSMPPSACVSLTSAALIQGVLTSTVPKQLTVHHDKQDFTQNTVGKYSDQKKIAIVKPRNVDSSLVYILANFTTLRMVFSWDINPGVNQK